MRLCFEDLSPCAQVLVSMVFFQLSLAINQAINNFVLEIQSYVDPTMSVGIVSPHGAPRHHLILST